MVKSIYVKDRVRRPGEFQFYMHQFVETLKATGVPSKQEINITYKYKLSSILNRAIRLLYTLRLYKKSKNSALIVTSRGKDLLSNSTPYYLKYEIIPMLWDVWPYSWNHIEKTIKLLKIKTVLVTVKSYADKLKSEYGINAIWVPEGIETKKYHKGNILSERDYDICELGRQYKPYHKIIQNLHKKGCINGFLRTIYNDNGKVLKFAFDTNDEMYEKLPQTKIMVNFPKSVTHPEEAGSVETLTQRYWEAMLCRCLIIGKAPKELIELAGYNPVIEVDWNHAEKQLTDIISHIEDYQELVDKNYAFAVKNASWESRIPMIKEEMKKLGYVIE